MALGLLTTLTMTRAALRNGIKNLVRPHQAYQRIDKTTLEEQVKLYLQLLIAMGIIAGVLTLLWNLGKAAYYDTMLGATVNYARMLNYLSGRVFGVMFGYLMVGTFGLFLLSIILNPFFKMKYTRLLQLLFIAITPIIMLAWVPQAATGVALWSLVIFIMGVKDAGSIEKVKKTSLQQRD